MSKYVDNNGLLYFWQKLKTLLAGKVSVESGKGLSANDYTTTEKTKLAGIAAGANAYTHPACAAAGAALIKVGRDAEGHVVLGSAVAKSDITGLGIPAQDTTYGRMTLQTEAVERGDGTYKPSMTISPGLVPGGTQMDPFQSFSSIAAAKAWAEDWGRRTVLTGVGWLGLQGASNAGDGLMSSSDYAKLAAFSAASNYALKSDITSMYKHKGSVAAVANLPTTGNTAGDVYNVTGSGMNYVWTGTEWDALGEIFSIDAVTNAEIDAICV